MDLSRPDGRLDARPEAMPWQERQRRMREAAILDAAAELLAERGYAATSMDEIAAHVGISKPTLYQHFPSKDAVAVAVTLARLARAAADLACAEAAVDAGSAARPQLERVLVDALARRAGVWATHVELPPAVLAASPDVGAAREDVWTRVDALVDRAKAEGACRTDVPTRVIVRYLSGLFRGDYADLGARDESPDAFAATLVSLVFDGLAPRPGGAARPLAVAGAAAGRPARAAARRATALLALVCGAGAAARPARLAAQVAPAQVVPAAAGAPPDGAPTSRAPADPPADPRARPTPGPLPVPPLDSRAPLGAPSSAARVVRPQPLFSDTIPRQTERVTGVPTQAGGQAPGAPATAAALAGRPLTLADVLDAALRANPSASAAFANAEASRAQYLSARGNRFPLLTFTPGITRSQTIGVAGGGTAVTTGGTAGTGTGTGGSGGSGSGAGTGVAVPALGTGVIQRTSFTPSLGLSFLLFDFGGRAGTIGNARETANATAATFDATVLNTLLQAQTAYFGYQSARDVVTASEQNVRTAGFSRDASVALFRAGLATVADTLQAATALAQARVNLLNARTQLTSSRDTLATLANTRGDVPFAVAAERAPTGEAAALVTGQLTARVDTLVAHAVRTRPDVDATRDQALAAQQQVRSARSALLPQVTVTGTAGYNNVYGGSVPINGYTYNLQLGLSVPVFDGGARRATLQAANANADAARARADAATTSAVNSVVTSADGLRQGADRLQASETLLGTAERNAEVALGRYQEGVGTIVDLLNAQTTLANARSTLAQARWAWATSLAQLSRNAGLLGRRGELPAVAAPAVPASTPLSTPNSTDSR